MKTNLSTAAAPLLMHGRDWEGDDPAGWFVTEKLDGCRCYWDGAAAWSKDGNPITLPPHILETLPASPLDGEIYAGRGNFEIARSAVQYGRWLPEVRFVAFDRPDQSGNLMRRTRNLRHVLTCGFCLTPHLCDSYSDLIASLREVQSNGGEGLMIYSPKQPGYVRARTSSVLKVKHVLPLLS